MSLQVARGAWRRLDSAIGSYIWDTEPLGPDRTQDRDERLAWNLRRRRRGWAVLNGHLTQPRSGVSDLIAELAARERANWPGVLAGLRAAGAPTAMRGNFSGPTAYTPAQALAAVTGGTTNVAWWSPSTYSPIPANSVQAPCAFGIWAGGLITSSAGAQTITMNPGIGTAVAGAALGPSSALVLGTTITNAFWALFGRVIVRTSGTSGTAVGNFDMDWTTAAGASPGTPTATNPSKTLFGGGNTVATADFQATAQGILIAATPSAAGVSVTPNHVIMTSFD
jgi:hypothetical protein